jgi:TP901 family phage tail tape measure protein
MIGGGGLYGLEVLVNLADQFSGPILGPIGRLEELQATALQADQALEQMQSGMALVGVGAGLIAPLGLATQAAMDFESAFADVRKVVDFPTPDAPRALSNDLLALSTDIPVVANGLTKIAAAAGAAGIQFGELTTFTKDAAEMSIAFQMTAKDSGQSLSELRNIFGLTQNEVRSLGDSVNYLSNNMASEAPAILDVLSRVGGTAKVIGMTGQEIGAFASAMLSTGTPAEVVATGLNAVIMRLSTATQQSKDFQTGLEGLGLGARELETAMRRDAAGSIQSFLEVVQNSKDPLSTLSLLFGAEYADDVAKLSSNLVLVKQGLGLVADSTSYAGSMSKEYEVRLATTENKLLLLGNQFNAISIKIGETFLPIFGKALDIGRDFLKWVDGIITTYPLLVPIVGGVTAAFGMTLITLGIVVMVLGSVGFASAQAKIGLEFLKATVGGIRGMFLGSLAPIQGFTAELVRLGAAASTTSLVDQLRLEESATGFQRLGLAIRGIPQMFMNAAGAARTFTFSLLTNPIFLIVAAVLALGAAFVWAWSHVEGFQQNVMEILQPLMLSFADLKAGVIDFLNQFNGIGDWIAGQFGGANEILGILAFGFGFVMGFILTIVIITFTRIATTITQVLGGVVDVISGIVQTVVGLFTGDMDKARTGVDKIFQGIIKIISSPLRLLGIEWFRVQESLNAAWDWMNGWLDKAIRWGADFGQSILKTFDQFVQYVSKIMQPLSDEFNNFISAADELIQALTPIGAWILQAIQPVLTWLQGAAQTVMDVFGAIGTWIVQALTPAATGVQGFGVDIGAVFNVIITVLRFFGNIIWAVGGLFIQTLGLMFTSALKLMSAIGATIFQALGGVVRVITGVVQTVVGLFTGDLDKARTGVSNIFKGIFQIITAPLRMLGIDWKAVESSLNAAWQWMTDWMGKAWQWGTDLIGGIVQNIKNTAGDIWRAITGAVSGKSLTIPTVQVATGEAAATKPSPTTTPAPTVSTGGVRESATINPTLNQLPKLENNANVHSNLEPLKALEPITPILNPLPKLETVANVSPNFKTLEPISPTLNPLPRLETKAKVNTILEPLKTLETVANVSPNFKTLEPITPILNPLPKLETDAKINTILEPLKALQATAEVTANLNSLPTLEGSANVRTGIENTQLFKTKLEKPERLERTSSSSKSTNRPTVTIQTGDFIFQVPTPKKGEKYDMADFIEEVKRQFVPMLTEALEREASDAS